MPTPQALSPLHPRPASRVNVADRFARAFSPLACVKGYMAYSKRKVALVEKSDDEVDVEVKGTRVAKVVLRAKNGRLAASCTCTATILGPPTCKHVWAALLEVDRCGVFSSLRDTARSLALDAVTVSPPSPRSPRATDPPPAKRGRPRRAPQGS